MATLVPQTMLLNSHSSGDRVILSTGPRPGLSAINVDVLR
jgi:hypothetical protein